MTLTGSLILVIISLTLFAWLLLSAWWRTRLRLGARQLSIRDMRSLPSPYEGWLNACGMRPMESGKTYVQRFQRKGMGDLYVAGVAGVSTTFYSLDELSEWLVSKGVPFEDPVWDHIDRLVKERD